MSEWIAREIPPQHSDADAMGRVLVWNETTGFAHLLHVDWFSKDGNWYTHWMPLPEPPQ